MLSQKSVDMSLAEKDDGIVSKKRLRPLGNGFYVDDNNLFYFVMSEYLKANLLADQAAERTRVWQILKERFGKDGIIEIVDSGE
jgi:hypothetical protein